MKFILALLFVAAVAYFLLRGGHSTVERTSDDPAAEVTPATTTDTAATSSASDSTAPALQVRMSFKQLLGPTYRALMESTEQTDLLKGRNQATEELRTVLLSAPRSTDREVAYKLCGIIDRGITTAKKVADNTQVAPTSTPVAKFRSERERAQAEKAAKEAFFHPSGNSEWLKQMGPIQAEARTEWAKLTDVGGVSGRDLLAYMRAQALRQPNAVVTRLRILVGQKREGGAFAQVSEEIPEGEGAVGGTARPANKAVFVVGLTHLAEKSPGWVKAVRDGNYTLVAAPNSQQSLERWIFIEDFKP